MIFQWFINFSRFYNQGQTIAIGRVFWFTGKVSRSDHYFFWYYVILVFVVVLGFAVRNLLRGKHGRCLVAVRDNDRAADAMGMHPGFTKVYAFALSGFFAGVAGALHAGVAGLPVQVRVEGESVYVTTALPVPEDIRDVQVVTGVYDPNAHAYVPLERDPRIISLADRKASGPRPNATCSIE